MSNRSKRERREFKEATSPRKKERERRKRNKSLIRKDCQQPLGFYFTLFLFLLLSFSFSFSFTLLKQRSHPKVQFWAQLFISPPLFCGFRGLFKMLLVVYCSNFISTLAFFFCLEFFCAIHISLSLFL